MSHVDPATAAAVPAGPKSSDGITYGTTESVAEMARREAAAPHTGVVMPPPELPYPDRRWLPQNPSAQRDMPSAPATALPAPATGQRSAVPYAAQTLGVSFTGATLFGTNPTFAFPPDTMAAVGPTQFIVAVNNRIVSFNKSSGAADGVLNVSTNTFFTSVRNGSGTSDPRIRYDRLSGRWFVIIINVSTPNRILLAWSDSGSNGTITGGTTWTTAYFTNLAGSTCLADYPTLGIDRNALYIGTNNFCGSPSQSFAGTDGYVLPKSPLLSNAGSVYRFPLVTSGGGAGPFTPQGVDNYDPSATEGYFIGVDNQYFGQIDLQRVSNPGGTPTVGSMLALSVSATSYPRTVPHSGNTGGSYGELDALDDRLFAAHIRNGRLWTAHNITVDASGAAVSYGNVVGRVAARWYELAGIRSTDGSPTIVQSGTVYDGAASASSARYYWIPSVMVSGQGHAAIGFSTAGDTFRVNAATAGRLLTDSGSTMQGVSIYTSTGSSYNPPDDSGGLGGRRWGDYSYTSLDPIDDMTMWTIQEFCDSSDSYGVRAVKLIAPPPATPSIASPASISTGLASVSVTITGTSSGGSGFFDPGSDLGSPARPFSHISAAVSGGVTVNSITYINPTSVTLNLSTVGASAGLKTVTITNPDGQTASGSILTLSGGGGGGPTASSFYLVTPCRLIDTRNTNGPFGGPSLAAGIVRNVPAAGNCGISASAKSIAVNVTAVSATSGGWLTLYPGPSGAAVPTASSLNYSSGKTLANNAVVSVGVDGSVNVFNSGPGAIHFIIDVNGYFQ